MHNPNPRSPYLVVGIAAGLAAYRFDLPMTVRSTLYELLGPYCWGWMGDVVDGFSIVTTVAGVCTSLGIGAIQIVAGAKRLGWMDDGKEYGYLRHCEHTSIHPLRLHFYRLGRR